VRASKTNFDVLFAVCQCGQGPMRATLTDREGMRRDLITKVLQQTEGSKTVSDMRIPGVGNTIPTRPATPAGLAKITEDAFKQEWHNRFPSILCQVMQLLGDVLLCI
jgi:hypothetical protein